MLLVLAVFGCFMRSAAFALSCEASPCCRVLLATGSIHEDCGSTMTGPLRATTRITAHWNLFRNGHELGCLVPALELYLSVLCWGWLHLLLMS